jgi:chromosome segregation ATPase
MTTPADNANTNGGGSSTDGHSQTDGNTQSTTSNGEGDWKAKAETLQKELDQSKQEANLHRNRATELQGKLESAIKDKESAVSEVTNIKAEQAQAEKTRAAETKQTEILSKVSDKTRELVKDLGLSLPDAEDADAVKAFEEKVQKLDATASTTTNESTTNKPAAPSMNGNNTRTDTADTTKPTNEQESLDAMRAKVADVKF